MVLLKRGKGKKKTDECEMHKLAFTLSEIVDNQIELVCVKCVFFFFPGSLFSKFTVPKVSIIEETLKQLRKIQN